METRRKSDYEFTYTRKPLKVAVPNLGDLQAHKNPFNKSLRSGTFSPVKSPSLLTCKEAAAANFHAHTVCAVKRQLTFPRPEAGFVTQPGSLATEMGESVTEDPCDWIIESEFESKSEEDDENSLQIQEEKESLEDLTEFQAKLTRELVHNFTVIRSMPPATLEEIELRQTILSFGKKSTDKILVLDLDDTLVHTINPAFNYSGIDVAYSEAQPVFYKDGESPSYYSIRVVIRPGAVELLKELSSLYEIIVSLYSFFFKRQNK